MKSNMRSFSAIAVGVIAACVTAAAVAAAVSGSSTGSLADTLRATARYHSLAAAKADGYGLLKDKKGIACIAMGSMPGMGAMGVHYAKPSLVGDGIERDIQPEALVYAPTASGSLQLAAIEYVTTKAAWDAHHNGVPKLFGQEFNFTPAGNRFGLPAYYSLHVWLYKHNPAGKFAMWNPTVSCKGQR
jgi:hypothetical protein